MRWEGKKIYIQEGGERGEAGIVYCNPKFSDVVVCWYGLNERVSA